MVYGKSPTGWRWAVRRTSLRTCRGCHRGWLERAASHLCTTLWALKWENLAYSTAEWGTPAPALDATSCRAATTGCIDDSLCSEIHTPGRPESVSWCATWAWHEGYVVPQRTSCIASQQELSYVPANVRRPKANLTLIAGKVHPIMSHSYTLDACSM